MKQTTTPSLLRRLSAFVVAAALALPTVYASAGEQKIQTVHPLMDGLTYVNTVTNHPTANRVESFALEYTPDSKVFPITVQGSGTIYSAASINKAVTEAQAMGYRVLGAINTDYFSPATGVPMGMVIEDGVYKSSPEGAPALTVTDGQFSLLESPAVTITLENQSNGQQTALTHLNKWRTTTGGLYLLNEDFSTVSSRTSGPGWAVRMQELNGDKLTVDGQLTLEVTELLQTSESFPIGEGSYILTAADEGGFGALFQSFQVGDVITLNTSTDTPELAEVEWASGTGDVMIRDGALTDSANWIHIKEGRAPRTAFGVRADGSSLLYVVDGRQNGYSGGLSQVDLAYELLAQGCVWAVNLDGGGSSAMSVWVPGQSAPAPVNRPSDGRLRGCATYLLLVTEEEGDGRPHRLVLKNDGPVVLTGTSVDLGEIAVLDDGLNPLDEDTSDVTIRSQNDLGTVEDGIYTAGDRGGMDTLELKSRDLDIRGTAQVRVVSALSELTVTRSGSDQSVTSLNLKPGTQVSLDATGKYWGRTAMRDQSGVTWAVEGNVGTVDETGLFTAAPTGGLSGSITATAGGLTKTIRVKLDNAHVDVPESHWAYTAVDYCYQNELVSGISPNEFGPNLNIRRGDFLLMLYKAAGSPAVNSTVNFPDVSPSDYYATAIAWAQENGLASGMEDGTFAPKTNVTREQSFTMLNKVLPLLGIHCESAPLSVLDQFTDKADLAGWAAEHAATLVANQFVGGSDGKLNPRGNLSRAEMAALLYKLGNYVPQDSAVTGISLNYQDVTLQPGEQLQLSATLEPSGVNGRVAWTVDDGVPNGLGVSADGLVTNLNLSGKIAVLTVTASSGGATASCTVRCLPALRSGVVAQGTENLNVRSGPSTDHQVLDRITDGQGVLIREEVDGGWLHIQYLSKSGAAMEGYVSADYITMN